jgi:hypothetical protein
MVALERQRRVTRWERPERTCGADVERVASNEHGSDQERFRFEGPRRLVQ